MAQKAIRITCLNTSCGNTNRTPSLIFESVFVSLISPYVKANKENVYVHRDRAVGGNERQPKHPGLPESQYVGTRPWSVTGTVMNTNQGADGDTDSAFLTPEIYSAVSCGH